MKYTRYFAQLIKQHGMINLPPDEVSVFLNIIHLEANLETYNAWNSTQRYNPNIGKINDKLNQLTGKLEPKTLVEKWINGDSPNRRLTKKEYNTWDEDEEHHFRNVTQYRSNNRR